jgi:glycosyltransferase involved in cell wall biosynthesis
MRRSDPNARASDATGWHLENRIVIRKKKLLFLAYFFPPVNAIGAVRGYSVAKWLTRLGWEVTVVTPTVDVWRNSDDGPGVESRLRREGIRYVRTNHHWRILSPGHVASSDSWISTFAGRVSRRLARLSGLEMEVGWIKEAERACAALEGEDVDLILATGAPFGSFELASRLASRLDRPFVLDYRDLWSANPHASVGGKNVVTRERILLERCAAATVVSPGVAESLAGRYPQGEKLHVITNGFDPEELATVKPQAYDHFAIVYAGAFYPPKRVITPVMTALSRLVSLYPRLRNSWAFHYYGWHSEHVRVAAAAHGLGDRVFIHGLKPRAQVLSALKGAGVSVVISSVEESGSVRDRGIVTGKVFDAVGLGTPMLVVAPTGSDLEVIVRTAGRGQRFAGNETDRMAEFLANAMAGRIPPRGAPETYAWPEMISRLDSILTAALNGGTGRAPGGVAQTPRSQQGG